MSRDIAFYGKYSLRYKTYLGDHQYTTHDIEIVKWNDDGHCYTIASWNNDKEPDLVLCGTRLLDEIYSMYDVQAIRTLVGIGELILYTDPEPINLD